jgi:hypothetical protein
MPRDGLRVEIRPLTLVTLVLFGVFLVLLAALTVLQISLASLTGEPDAWSIANQNLVDWLLPLLPLLLALMLAIVVHEGGHALAGRLVGLWLYQCKIGPLVLTRTRRGVRLSLSKHRWSGGHVISCPLDDRSLRRRYGVFAAGGPLASLVLTMLAGWLARDFLTSCVTGGDPFLCLPYPDPFNERMPSFWMLLLLSTVSVSTVAFISTAIPYALKDQTSDGFKVLTALRSGPASECALLFWQIACYRLRGVRPREWPAAAVLRAVTLADTPSRRCNASIYAYCRALDSGDVASAGVYLDAALASVTPPERVQPTLALEAAFFEARYRFNLPAAQFWQSQGKGSRFEALMQARAGAAMLLAEGRAQEAAALATSGLAVLLKVRQTRQELFIGLAMEEDSLRGLIAEAQRQQAAQAQMPPAEQI